MSNLNEIPSDTGHYAASARPVHLNGLQIVPLKIDTGLYAASQRAAHQILDNPKIFEDLLALRIIGAEAESKLRRSCGVVQAIPESGGAHCACAHGGGPSLTRDSGITARPPPRAHAGCASSPVTSVHTSLLYSLLSMFMFKGTSKNSSRQVAANLTR